MFAGAHGLDNLVALVDVNRTQADGELVLEVEPVGDKFRAFGWTAHTVDGHDLDAIASALDSTKSAASGPTVIVANTRLAEGAPSLQSRANAHFVRVGADQWDQVAAEVGGSR